jgi:AraC-like DNA-binding protein
MVSHRCKLIVKIELAKLGIKHYFPEGGAVEIISDISEIQRNQLHISLKKAGMDLLEETKISILERLTGCVEATIYKPEEYPVENYRAFLSEKLGYDYPYLSEIFAEVNGVSIEQYIINQKVERIKEFLLYDTLTLAEICKKLHYSNLATMTYQFNKVTGLTPLFFKQLRKKRMQLTKAIPIQELH